MSASKVLLYHHFIFIMYVVRLIGRVHFVSASTVIAGAVHAALIVVAFLVIYPRVPVVIAPIPGKRVRFMRAIDWVFIGMTVCRVLISVTVCRVLIAISITWVFISVTVFWVFTPLIAWHLSMVTPVPAQPVISLVSVVLRAMMSIISMLSVPEYSVIERL